MDDLTLSVNNLTKVKGAPEPLCATLSYDGMVFTNIPVTFEINGVSYVRRTINNTACLNINLDIGTYPCVVTFEGDEDFNPVSKTVTVTVTDKHNVNLIAGDYTKTYNETGALQALLYEGTTPLPNKMINYTINGISYDRETDSNGKAKLNIRLDPGIYPCTVAFKGDTYYKPSSHLVTVTVRSNTNIVGTDIEKKSSELKVFKCKLVNFNNDGFKGTVKLTINGVTYVRTTNDNGEAELNIRLGEGNYVLSCVYDGEGLYNPCRVDYSVIVHPDVRSITKKTGDLIDPGYNNLAYMRSHIYVKQYDAEYLKTGNYYPSTTPFEYNDKALRTDIQFTEYEITETDPRVKTATFKTPTYFDLTYGQAFVWITSPFHENFGGQILKVDYDKSTGLYNYQCQDGRRFYQTKNSTIIKESMGLSIYDVLEGRLIFPVMFGESYLPISNEQRNTHKKLLSGLRPLEEYNIPLSPVTVPINKLAEPCPPLIAKDSNMDKIMALAHYGGTPVDVHFDANRVCQIEPVNLKEWMNTGLRLTHSDLVHYKYGFDITNVITAVGVSNDSKNHPKWYNDAMKLRFYFGRNDTIIDNNKSNNSNTSSTSNTTSGGGGVGSKIMSGKKTFVVSADNINGNERTYINKVISALQAKGHTCINAGVGPNNIQAYGRKSKAKGTIACVIVGGQDGGVYYDFVQNYYNFDHMIQVYASNTATTDKWITCNGLKNTKCYIDPRQGYSSVVYRSGVQNYTPQQWCQKYPNKTSYVCGPLGCSFDDVVSNLVNGRFGSDGTTTNTTVTTNTTATNTVSNSEVTETENYQKALEEMSKSVRSLLSFELRVPLNNTLFKDLHTNQMLWTELPKEFKLGNLETIFKILPSYKVNRGVAYQENRWYVEGLKIKCNHDGLFADITLNPFPSSYSTYANAVKSYMEAYNQAFNSSSETTTTNGTTITNTGVGLGNPLLGKDCTDTNSMRAMSGGGYGNSGHGKNFDSKAQKGYAVQGANYYNWARQYSDVKSLLHALASKFHYSSYWNNQKCPQKVFNSGAIYANCYDACRLVKVCCDSCGFPCVIITGSIWQGGHGWNAVKYNGTWYTFDLCYASKGTSTKATNSFRAVW